MSREGCRDVDAVVSWAPPWTEVVYVFAAFELDPARRVLLRVGQPVPLTGRGFDLLLLLVRNRHRVLSRAELLRELWPDVCIEDGNLSVNVSLVRKALGEGGRAPSCIATLPRRGYRFVADVETLVPHRLTSARALEGPFWANAVAWSSE
jgi:DNA-binding winged helix-turn-helix (wHTH) protein